MSDLVRSDSSANNDPIVIHRKEAGGGGGDPGTGSAVAAAAVSTAQENSSGAPLEAGTRSKMEGAFGADFSDVKVHTGAESGQAAKDINANAFATGSDIHFAQGQYEPGSEDGEKLIAHELAHVVQTGGQGGMAAKAAGGGASVSSPSDAHEQAADRAAESAVRGEKVGNVGTAPAGGVHRDALGDLKSAADGNWLGSVDGGGVLSKARALSPADKTALKTGDTYDALNRRIFKKLSTGECLEYFNILGGLDLRWKLYWLNEGGRLDDLIASQWQWLIGYASPQTMDLLRQYPTGYKAFLKNAPLEMITPWDRLQGLEDGSWSGSATDIRNAVANLNPDQKAKVRADNDKITKILQKCGNAEEKYRVVTYLEFKLKWSISWLNSQKLLPGLSQQQWSQLLTEATRADYDELVGWGEMWAIVQKHCPASVLQVTRQNSDPATAASAFDDPVQIDTMFSTLGAAGFLATATRNGAAVDDVYTKIQAKSKVLPTVDGLPTGAQMGATSKANLRQWFFTAASTDAECTKMFEQRFRVQTTGGGTYNHTSDATVNLQPFTKQGLTQMWTVCEAMPPAHVENNPRLLNILRNQNSGPGSAYYAGPGTGGQGDVLMGYRNDGELNQNVGGNSDNIYQAGGTGPGAPAVNMPMFNATLRHEIGHAVDSSLNVMDSWGRQEAAGGWTKYGNYTEFVDAIITASGGMNYGSADLNKKYREAMIHAVTQAPKLSFTAACTAKGITPPVANPGGAVGVVWDPTTYSDSGGGQPWYDSNWVSVAGRNFQDSYSSIHSLYSFNAAVRTARMVTAYQWRAPAEWFAEAYQVYYSEQEAGPGTPVGGRLRSKDAEAAQMISQICDRGYSPQAMSGGTVEKAPGT